MRSAILFTAICSLLFLATHALSADDAEPIEVTTLATENSEATQMSPLAVSTAQEQTTLAVAQDQIKQQAFTAMAPGICLVVDDIVRQFCAANPGDISCQFQ